MWPFSSHECTPLRIVVDPGGFVAWRAEKQWFDVRWEGVKEIAACKEDHFAVDCICLLFRVSDAQKIFASMRI
jgi:hypothetical protein